MNLIETNRFFDLLDEMFLKVYAECMSNVAEKIIYNRYIKEIEEAKEEFKFVTQ